MTQQQQPVTLLRSSATIDAPAMAARRGLQDDGRIRRSAIGAGTATLPETRALTVTDDDAGRHPTDAAAGR